MTAINLENSSNAALLSQSYTYDAASNVLTADARRMMGTDDTVDYSSGTYQIGEGVGTVVGMVLPGPKIKGLGMLDEAVEGIGAVGRASGATDDIIKTHLHRIVLQGFAKRLPFTMSLFDEVVQVPADIHQGWHSGKGLSQPGGYYNNWWWDRWRALGEDNIEITTDHIVSWFKEMCDNFNY